MSDPDDDEMRPEYDFSELNGAVRGKYCKRLQEGSNVVLLEPDVAEDNLDAHSVNEALHKVIAGRRQGAT